MKTFEEILIEVLVERSDDATQHEVQNAAKNYENMRKHFPFIAAVHDASIEAAQRFSDQNCEVVQMSEALENVSSNYDRNMFAAMAMPALIDKFSQATHDAGPGIVATQSVRFADALLEELNKTKP